jgi:hypothetical protein
MRLDKKCTTVLLKWAIPNLMLGCGIKENLLNKEVKGLWYSLKRIGIRLGL